MPRFASAPFVISRPEAAYITAEKYSVGTGDNTTLGLAKKVDQRGVKNPSFKLTFYLSLGRNGGRGPPRLC